MKDLYSFHADESDFQEYYNKVAESYKKIFARCGLKTFYTLAGGGEFTSNQTHEFQTPAAVGEDTIYDCEKCDYAENIEISKLNEGDKCPKCGGLVKKENSIEVGNIFPLGTKYSEAVDLKYTDKDGKQNFVIMGSYGIGLGRLMATVVESSHDNRGIIWPASIAPFDIHILELSSNNPRVRDMAKKAAETLQKVNSKEIAILYDDRKISAGEKFADSDLLGIPVGIVISEKGFEDNSVEVVWRKDKSSDRVDLGVLSSYYSQRYGENSR
jgi:prolyl-tRNA synthetase